MPHPLAAPLPSSHLFRPARNHLDRNADRSRKTRVTGSERGSAEVGNQGGRGVEVLLGHVAGEFMFWVYGFARREDGSVMARFRKWMLQRDCLWQK